MSQKSLYDFETEQIDKMFDCKNYLFKNSKHEKVILESDTGVKKWCGTLSISLLTFLYTKGSH